MLEAHRVEKGTKVDDTLSLDDGAGNTYAVAVDTVVECRVADERKPQLETAMAETDVQGFTLINVSKSNIKNNLAFSGDLGGVGRFQVDVSAGLRGPMTRPEQAQPHR